MGGSWCCAEANAPWPGCGAKKFPAIWRWIATPDRRKFFPPRVMRCNHGKILSVPLLPPLPGRGRAGARKLRPKRLQALQSGPKGRGKPRLLASLPPRAGALLADLAAQPTRRARREGPGQGKPGQAENQRQILRRRGLQRRKPQRHRLMRPRHGPNPARPNPARPNLQQRKALPLQGAKPAPLNPVEVRAPPRRSLAPPALGSRQNSPAAPLAGPPNAPLGPDQVAPVLPGPVQAGWGAPALLAIAPEPAAPVLANLNRARLGQAGLLPPLAEPVLVGAERVALHAPPAPRRAPLSPP